LLTPRALKPIDIVKCLHATSTLGDELAVMLALATGQIIADVEAVDAVVFAVSAATTIPVYGL
jgi:hypothetical protein